MIILICGLVIFFGIHSIQAFKFRNGLIRKFSEGGYKGIYSLISLMGIALVVYGKGESEFIPLWNPPVWGRHVTMLMALPAMIFLAISILPNNMKRAIRHPMLLGVATWGFAHLMSNGDLASIILFGGFLVFSIYKIFSVTRRKPFEKPAPVSMVWNIGSIFMGCTLYGLAIFFHQFIAGVSLF